MGGGSDASMDAFYDYATINDRMLGFADPLKVQAGQRVLLHLLNASATVTDATEGSDLGSPILCPSIVDQPRGQPRLGCTQD